MFIVIDSRYREIARTNNVAEAMRLKAHLNSCATYKAAKPFGVSYLPARMLPEVLNVIPFPKRR